MSRQYYKTLTYRYHQNVIDSIVRFFNYRRYVGRAYHIVYNELKRTGMTKESVIVLCQHKNKLIHRICHNANDAYQLSKLFHRKVIINMHTGKYLDIIHTPEPSFNVLDDKLQPVNVKNQIQPPDVIAEINIHD